MMVEVHTRLWETQQQKGSVFTAETVREIRQPEQETQTHQPVTPPSSKEEREERHTAKQKQRIQEELGHTGEQSNDGRTKDKAAWTPEDEKLFNVIFGDETEEERNAHNERFKADKEKEQQKKDKFHEEMLKRYEEYHARLAAMTPEEREAWEKQWEKDRTRKRLTPDELTQLLYEMHTNVQAMRRKRAAWLHERDPRYDPMTGDLLDSDEHPLDPTAEYTFYGKTRARSFVHPEARSFLSPDSPLLEHREPLQADGKEEVTESEYHERLVARLLKAGFVEVEPTLADKASFEQAQWYRSLSPSEKMQFLRDSMREMTHGKSSNKETAKETPGEKFAKFIKLLIELLIALIDPEMKRDQPAQKAA
jgi:hypothetical protein